MHVMVEPAASPDMSIIDTCGDSADVFPSQVTRDARRLIVVRKRWTGSTGWSDAIQKFYEAAAGRFSAASLLEISVRGIDALLTANRDLDALAQAGGSARNLVILVNHSICWWAISPTLRRLKHAGATIVLCMHEHEHILGTGYVRRYRGALNWKEVLRHSRLYHGIPARHSSRVLVLAEAQAAVLGVDDAIRCSYLPVDAALFPPAPARTRPTGSATVVLFAHDPKRFDKGHRFVDSIRAGLGGRVEWAYGRNSNLPFDQVFRKYWGADVLFLPSDWESYSLVFVEALACNKLIVCSPHVGAVKLLQAKYSIERLAVFGVLVTQHEAGAYAAALERAAARADTGEHPRTRALFDEFELGSVQLPVELI
jgi:glycosyltransferase involved in cell wall biosynthesis